MRLVTHSLYNLAGLGLPLLAAVFSIPILIHELGDARFGVLTLIWAVVSYFGLFDLGLGRALTQLLSVELAKGDPSETRPLIATGLWIMTALGVAGGVVMAVLAPFVVGFIQAVPDQNEVVNAILAMAFAVPFIILTSGFRGVLEARHQFGIINVIRLPMGLYTFIAPMIVVLYGIQDLGVIAAVLAIGRCVGCGVHGWFAAVHMRDIPGALRARRELVRPLCVSGGWLTISNIISPIMSFADRFMIGALLSASAVAYYATPQELVMKLWVVPGAVTAVLFPTFAAEMVRSKAESWNLFQKAATWLFCAMLPITLALALFAEPILSTWINPEFAARSAGLMKIFCLGMLVGSMAQLPFTVLQSTGRSDITAWIHTAELPFFILLVAWLGSTYGLSGVAYAWLIRVVLDAVLMAAFCFSSMGKKLSSLRSDAAWVAGALTLLGFGGAFAPAGYARVVLFGLTSIVLVVGFKMIVLRRVRH